MRLLAVLALLIAPSLLVYQASADQNPAPTNVGLYNYSTYTVTATTNYAVLPKNIYRALLVVENNGAASVVVKPGSAPANSTDGILVGPNQQWAPSPPMVDALFIQSYSGSNKVIMIEGAK